MRVTMSCMALAFGLMVAAPAFADGCLKGGAVGAVVGHEVGSGHSIAGAAAGCAIGHHEASKAKQKQAQQAQRPDTNSTSQSQ